jgi:RNA polymerase sigma-70 factor (ECF subfamily)
VWSLDVQDGVIRNIRSVVNPDKLRHIGPTIDLKTARG